MPFWRRRKAEAAGVPVAPPPQVPVSDEVLEHLLGQCRQGSPEALAEIERLYRPLLDRVVLSYHAHRLLPFEQLEVCCSFALQRAARAYDEETRQAVTFVDLAEEWMRLEVEETVRQQVGEGRGRYGHGRSEG